MKKGIEEKREAMLEELDCNELCFMKKKKLDSDKVDDEIADKGCGCCK